MQCYFQKNFSEMRVMSATLLQHIFLRVVENFPSKIALIIGEEEFTYKTLYCDVISLSNYLSENGLVSRDRVLIQASNSYFLVVAFWSVLLLGGTVSIIPPDIDSINRDDIIENFQPQMVIGYDLAEDQRDRYFCDLDEINYLFFPAPINFDSDYDVSLNLQTDFTLSNIISSDIVMIIYTSGSTGNPKGVMLTHSNMLSAIRSIQDYLTIDEYDCIYSVLPMHFDYGLYQLLLGFYVGATLILGKGMMIPTVYLHNIKKYSVSVLPVLPTIVTLLAKVASNKTGIYCSVKKITNTGEHLSTNQIDYLKQTFSNADIYLMYGLTECKRCSYVPPMYIDIKKQSIGIPMPNLAMWIANKDGEELSAYSHGEIVVSSPTLMQGYWRKSHETNDKVKVDRYGRRCFYTGDIGYKDHEGFFYLVGRKDSIVKLNGEKCDLSYYLSELEKISTVMRAHLFLNTLDNNEKKLFVAIENDNDPFSDNIDLQRLRTVFSTNHQPAYFYFTKSFPSLKSGKLNFRLLESITVCAYHDSLIVEAV